MFSSMLSFAGYGIIIIAAITVGVVIVRSNTIKATAEVNKSTNETNEANIRALQTENGIQAKQMIAINKSNDELKEQVIVLSSKVETLSTIPVQKIEQHMADANKQMADTNKILRAVLPLLNQQTTEHTVTNTTKVIG